MAGTGLRRVSATSALDNAAALSSADCHQEHFGEHSGCQLMTMKSRIAHASDSEWSKLCWAASGRKVSSPQCGRREYAWADYPLAAEADRGARTTCH
jgi:hypothetical protein